MPGIDQSRQFVPLKIAVLTVSDTRAADEDKSGATLIERGAIIGPDTTLLDCEVGEGATVKRTDATL